MIDDMNAQGAASREARSQPCPAMTRTGQRCRIGADESGLCHIHNPERHCTARKADGSRCTVQTGSGGFCWQHRNLAPEVPSHQRWGSYGPAGAESGNSEDTRPQAHVVAGGADAAQGYSWALVVHSGQRRWIYPADSRTEAVSYLTSGQFAPSADDRMLFEVVPTVWVSHLPGVDLAAYDQAALMPDARER